MKVRQQKPESIDTLITKLKNNYSPQEAIALGERIVKDYLVTKKLTLKRAEFLLSKVQDIVNENENV